MKKTKKSKSQSKQRVEKVKLKNGLEVHFLFDKRFTTSSIQMCFKVGWRNDKTEHNGLAHLFEHLVGKRTKKYQGKSEFSRKLDEMGIVCNAYTGPDITVYYQNQVNENLLNSLSMLYEAVYFSCFDGEDLEKEKRVVLNEAREYLDNDDAVVWRQMLMNLFPQTTMEKFFFGDEGSMSRITLHEFEEFYNIYKNPKNSILFVSTDNPKYKQKVLNFLKSFYTDKNNQKMLSDAKVETFQDKPNEVVKVATIEKPDRSQANLRLGYKIDKFAKRDRVVFGVINSVLLGGFSGKIIETLRDKEGLIYWMSLSRNMFMQDVCYVMFSTGCEKTSKLLVINKIKEVIDNTREGLVQSEIDKTIPIKVYNQKSPPNPYDDLAELMESVVYDTDYIQTEEYLKILKSIKVSEVKALMQKIFKEENSSVVYLE